MFLVTHPDTNPAGEGLTLVNFSITKLSDGSEGTLKLVVKRSLSTCQPRSQCFSLPIYFLQSFWVQYFASTVNSRCSGHPGDHDLVSVIGRVRNNGVRENFYFKPYLQKGVTSVFIFINSSIFFRPVIARKKRQNFIYKQSRT